ncbi:MAG: hypothetical protein ACLS43_04635 [Evtepia gabavorous]
MTEEQRDLLCRGLTRLGVPYTPEAVERLGLYCRRLLEKNQVMNLTPSRIWRMVMTLHLTACPPPTRPGGKSSSTNRVRFRPGPVDLTPPSV